MSCLRQRQRLARGDAQLPLDQVQAGHQLGDRMLDLQAGVDLHEVEIAVGADDELHRAGVEVVDRARRLHRGLRPCCARSSGVRNGEGDSSMTFW